MQPVAKRNEFNLPVSVFHDLFRFAVERERPQVALQLAMLHERLWLELNLDASLKQAAERMLTDHLEKISIKEHGCYAGWATIAPLGKKKCLVYKLFPGTVLSSVSVFPCVQRWHKKEKLHVEAKLFSAERVECSQTALRLRGNMLFSELLSQGNLALNEKITTPQFLVVQCNEDFPVSLTFGFEN